MVIYVEYVLLENLIIDYLLMKATLKITKKKSFKFRLFISVLFGAGFSVFYPLIENLKVLSFILKILVGLIMTLICADYKGIKEYFKFTAVFFLFTFSVGGGISGIFGAFNVKSGEEVFYLLSVIPIYLIIKLIEKGIMFLYKRKTVFNFTYDCVISVNNKSIKCKGFMDTGNSLYDGNYPIILITQKLALKLIDFKSFSFVKKVAIKTVNKNSFISTIKPDFVSINIDGREYKYTEVKLGIIKNESGSFYDLILHPDLIGEIYESKNIIKEVS